MAHMEIHRQQGTVISIMKTPSWDPEFVETRENE